MDAAPLEHTILMPAGEFAAFVGIPRWTIYRMYHAGELKGIQRSKSASILIPISEAKKFRIADGMEDMPRVRDEIPVPLCALPSDDKARRHRVSDGQVWING